MGEYTDEANICTKSKSRHRVYRFQKTVPTLFHSFFTNLHIPPRRPHPRGLTLDRCGIGRLNARSVEEQLEIVGHRLLEERQVGVHDHRRLRGLCGSRSSLDSPNRRAPANSNKRGQGLMTLHEIHTELVVTPTHRYGGVTARILVLVAWSRMRLLSA